jgi:hypothetical protein
MATYFLVSGALTAPDGVQQFFQVFPDKTKQRQQYIKALNLIQAWSSTEIAGTNNTTWEIYFATREDYNQYKAFASNPSNDVIGWERQDYNHANGITENITYNDYIELEQLPVSNII